LSLNWNHLKNMLCLQQMELKPQLLEKGSFSLNKLNLDSILIVPSLILIWYLSHKLQLLWIVSWFFCLTIVFLRTSRQGRWLVVVLKRGSYIILISHHLPQVYWLSHYQLPVQYLRLIFGCGTSDLDMFHLDI
jgi:hypothetical protein